jgi:hypothetical protein
MRGIIKDIITVLKCDEETALKVEDHMDKWFDLRYSSISQTALNRSIREASNQLKAI